MSSREDPYTVPVVSAAAVTPVVKMLFPAGDAGCQPERSSREDSSTSPWCRPRWWRWSSGEDGLHLWSVSTGDAQRRRVLP